MKRSCKISANRSIAVFEIVSKPCQLLACAPHAGQQYRPRDLRGRYGHASTETLLCRCSRSVNWAATRAAPTLLENKTPESERCQNLLCQAQPEGWQGLLVFNVIPAKAGTQRPLASGQYSGAESPGFPLSRESRESCTPNKDNQKTLRGVGGPATTLPLSSSQLEPDLRNALV